MDFIKLAKIMQTNGLKIIQNVKTNWLSILSLLQQEM